ncbi:MAG: hypothetical protein KVP17_004154 [Porospora cf. gigantea B]|uniref:uncharacterized protein n=1 Tax=Porospora cf. gigantea B TaxID=2853592 RepID=UPI003571CC07|nr:MAG: hypothetical protein KVP17_004154 [Porospora cf. gigantea B]
MRLSNTVLLVVLAYGHEEAVRVLDLQELSRRRVRSALISRLRFSEPGALRKLFDVPVALSGHSDLPKPNHWRTPEQKPMTRPHYWQTQTTPKPVEKLRHWRTTPKPIEEKSMTRPYYKPMTRPYYWKTQTTPKPVEKKLHHRRTTPTPSKDYWTPQRLPTTKPHVRDLAKPSVVPITKPDWQVKPST